MVHDRDASIYFEAFFFTRWHQFSNESLQKRRFLNGLC
ncbi:hypothetical protein FM107_19570 [Sphingobacterium sp. JB170]|nr:hypothetical protein FM107_19570 [Sphingobacterium sp. JB170]